MPIAEGEDGMTIPNLFLIFFISYYYYLLINYHINYLILCRTHFTYCSSILNNFKIYKILILFIYLFFVFSLIS